MSTARDSGIARKLTAWFERNSRSLPWRDRRSGYSALVSEAMLQQTQVSRVIEKYIAFMQQFPTVHDLAAASEQQVLAAWQGLGYYRRARNLHAAAKIIVAEHGGEVPADINALLTLPGVGRYTAGAVASIIYGKREPIVDGNVHRVLSRLDAVANLAASDAWTCAEQLVKRAERPGVFNEALMELGATVCTPRSPQCQACPLRQQCRAHKQDVADVIPAPKTASKQLAVHHHAVIIARGELILLQQRPSHGLWSNMWQVPTIEAASALSSDDVASRLPIRISSIARLGQFQHNTTHRRITFHVHSGRTRARSGQWRRLDDVHDLPMSNAQKRIMALAHDLLAAAPA